MTNEEAIKTLDSMLIGNESVEVFNAVQMAISALEKQIEMKPYYWNNEKHICPNCHRAEHIKKEPLNIYCGFCGQKIDWSDYND